VAAKAPDRVRADGEAAWKVVVDGFHSLTERGVEAVLAVANGHFGVRAALEEGGQSSNPVVIVAGVYVPTTSPARQTLLTLPDPAIMHLTIDGQPLRKSFVRTTEHLRELDLRRGVSTRAWTFVDHEGRSWRWESLRAASATRPDRYLYRLRLALEQGDAPVEVTLTLPRGAILMGEDRSSQIELVTARDTQTPDVLAVSLPVRAGPKNVGGGSISAVVEPGKPLLMSSASRIRDVDGGGEEEACDFADLFAEHEHAWKERWRVADVGVAGNPELQQAARFGAYHLLSAAAVNDGFSSVGPRDLSGTSYHGHVFWDTEIFVLPFLALTWPEAARSCLIYRHRTLDAARRRARSCGYEGAFYAWESTDTGEERTPNHVVLASGAVVRILNGEQENHIAADIPYAVVQYWRATGDDAFMIEYGAEILIECARFWCSRVSPAAQPCYSIRKVIGPDEYHDGVDNNAYTNAMARWTLGEAESYVGELRRSDPEGAEALLRRLGVRAEELREWRQVADSICRSSFLEDEVVEQFDGFSGLQEVDVVAFRQARAPLDIAVGHEAVQRMRVVKQADVLMALRLLPDLWTEASARRNMAYYEPLTTHTSSLSPPIHALLAAWLRDGLLCQTYLEQTVDIDLGSSFLGAASGIHIGALGGLWQALVFGLGGLKFSQQRLEFDPFLPPSVRGLSFTVLWRRRRVHVRVSHEGTLEVKVGGPPCEVRVNRERRLVKPGRRESFRFDPAVTYWSAREVGDGIDE
jgi:trehalose/maltose hydrolase-like predicted phosphorylase